MKSAMRVFPLRRDRSELDVKDIDKAGFLILHDKSYNAEACQHSPPCGIFDVQWTPRNLRRGHKGGFAPRFHLCLRQGAGKLFTWL